MAEAMLTRGFIPISTESSGLGSRSVLSRCQTPKFGHPTHRAAQKQCQKEDLCIKAQNKHKTPQQRHLESKSVFVFADKGRRA